MIPSTTDAKQLRCAECGLPFAIIQGGAIRIQSQHSGNKHINAISLEYVLRLMVESGYDVEAALKLIKQH